MENRINSLIHLAEHYQRVQRAINSGNSALAETGLLMLDVLIWELWQATQALKG